MKLSQLHEGNMLNLGLDLVGLIPGAEAADAANAALHIKQGEYFQAAMSILSLIPAVGDAIGKSAKYLGKSSPKIAQFIAKHGDKIARHWPKALEYIKKSKTLAPYAKQLDEIVKQYLGSDQQQQQPRQTAQAPTAAQRHAATQVQPQMVSTR